MGGASAAIVLLFFQDVIERLDCVIQLKVL